MDLSNALNFSNLSNLSNLSVGCSTRQTATPKTSNNIINKLITIHIREVKFDNASSEQNEIEYQLTLKWKSIVEKIDEDKVCFKIPFSGERMICLRFNYNGRDSGDKIELILEEIISDSRTIAWSIEMEVKYLLGDIVETIGNTFYFHEHKFNFRCLNKTTGFIVLDSTLNTQWKKIDGSYGDLTFVDSDLFVLPVKRLGVSGGSAAFYQLELKSPEEMNKKSSSHFIGKNLARAADEVSFYESIRLLQKSDKIEDNYLKEIFKFAFEYAGVVTASEDKKKIDENSLQLLVMRNLHDGRERTRLLDIKIGYETAAVGWKGKSFSHAVRQKVFDKFTNSRAEGFRLEGFDGCPKSLSSREEIFICADLKKARKLMYQGMNGSSIFTFFLDLRDNNIAKNNDLNCYSMSELAEVVMHEVVERLLRLKTACNNVHTPQKWIGSSIGIGFDCEMTPKKRSNAVEKDIRDGVITSIFDFGRSELNSAMSYIEMTPKEKEERRRTWNDYLECIDSLTGCAVQTYQNRFKTSQWKTLNFNVYDYDHLDSDDFLGSVKTSLKETTLKGRQLKKKVFPSGKLFYSIGWQEYPPSSRLAGSWIIYIEKATSLPRADIGSLSDPYVVISVESKDGLSSFDQYTSTIKDNLNPIWEETFEIPVARHTQLRT